MSYKTAFYVAAACLTLAILGNQLNYLNSLKQRELGRVEMKVWQDQWYAAHPVMPCAYAVYRADTDSKYRLYDVLTIGDCKDNPRPVVDVPPGPKPAPRRVRAKWSEENWWECPKGMIISDELDTDGWLTCKPAPRKAKPIQGGSGTFGGTTLPQEAYCEDWASGVKWMPRPDGSCYSADMPKSENPQ